MTAPRGDAEPELWVVVERWRHGGVRAVHAAPAHIKPWSRDEAEAEARRLPHNTDGYHSEFWVVPVQLPPAIRPAAPGQEEKR